MATDAAQVSLTLAPSAWNDEAAQWLAQAGTCADLIDYRADVEAGRASLFLVQHDGINVGAFLLRVDRYLSGADGVIVAAGADLPGVDLMGACVPSIETLFTGVQRIRYHTGTPAVARKMARLGYAAAEIVCIKELNNGQQIQ